MRYFHVTVHARPDAKLQTRCIQVDSADVDTVIVEQTQLTVPLTITFENAQERLNQKTRLFFEPDGSFVWVADAGPSEWQVDGLLNDRGDRLSTVELKGSAPRSVLESLLTDLDWPKCPILLQDLQRGIYYDVQSFYKFFG